MVRGPSEYPRAKSQTIPISQYLYQMGVVYLIGRFRKREHQQTFGALPTLKQGLTELNNALRGPYIACYRLALRRGFISACKQHNGTEMNKSAPHISVLDL